MLYFTATHQIGNMKMTLLTLLETIASKSSHNLEIESLLENQPEVVRQAFFSKDPNLLKMLFHDTTTITAHRSSIVHVNTD